MKPYLRRCSCKCGEMSHWEKVNPCNCDDGSCDVCEGYEELIRELGQKQVERMKLKQDGSER